MVLDFADMVRFIVPPRSHDSPTDRSILYLGDELIVKEGGGPCRDYLNQTTKDWYTRFVTLSETKGLSERFFAALLRNRMPNPHDTLWIPAPGSGSGTSFAGMTWPLFIHHFHCGGLLNQTT